MAEATGTAESVPLVGSGGGGGGGSALRGGLEVDTSIIMAPKPSFVSSPYGQRYLNRRAIGTSVGDVLARAEMWASNIACYYDHGTVSSPGLYGTTNIDNLLQDRYGLYRELGKRSIKYKALPITITDYTVWRDMDNADLFLLGNVGSLLNLSRLNHYNYGCSILTQYLGKYMSRLSRLWRSLSAKPMLGIVKSHGLRNSQITSVPGEQSVYIRWWSSAMLRSTNGPGNPDASIGGYSVMAILMNDAMLGKWVEYLETVERWSRMGATAIATDWIAIRDMIDMIIDVVPGVYTTGLPKVSEMPGITSDVSILTDVFARCVTEKDDVNVGTDQWNIFPVPDALGMNGRIPIAGFGQPGVMDFMLLGAPKFGIFSGDMTKQIGDVNSAVRLVGSDLRVTDQVLNPNGVVDADKAFGLAIASGGEEEILVEGTATAIALSSSIEVGSANDVSFLSQASLKSKHPWMIHRFAVKGGVAAGYNRWVESPNFGYLFYAEPADLIENNIVAFATAMGLPYLRG